MPLLLASMRRARIAPSPKLGDPHRRRAPTQYSSHENEIACAWIRTMRRRDGGAGLANPSTQRLAERVHQ
jgi:hypothetical protein